MSVVASIAMSFLNQVCEIPDVIDISPAERFGEAVVVITVPTDAEREKTTPLLAEVQHEYSLHVMTLFGLGSFTGDSPETQKVLSLLYVKPYNIYGTPENKELEALMKEVESREASIWDSMPPSERQAAILAEIERQRASGRQNFGNCWRAES